MAPADSIPIGQPLHSDLQYGADTGGYVRSHAASENVSPTGFSCSGVENDHISTVLVSDANEAELNCQSLFHIEGGGPSDEASHSLPFSWQ
ncbi:hypothetical protein HPP92_023376 [Vanilla planifolia]|uniref:Uncharacterized protein n=1 Tax=Vanilla planifolia TaxID=51239 RepID=A0A835PV75_VANPL|nr:hypothetical protein HPP92_023376 [Vanilla planifolia]